MDSARARKKSDIRPVIHNKRDAPREKQPREFTRGVEQFAGGRLLIPVLEETYSSIGQSPRTSYFGSGKQRSV
jgi:hypothetical protein